MTSVENTCVSPIEQVHEQLVRGCRCGKCREIRIVKGKLRCNEKGKKLRRERQKYVDSIKVQRGCLRCGYKDSPVALNFVRPDGSECNGRFASKITASMAYLGRLIDSCSVLCWRCHRIQMSDDGWKYRSTKTPKKSAFVKKSHERRRRFLNKVKLMKGCCDCHYRERPEALDFDHVRGEKKFNISTSLSRKMDVVKEEIRKTVVRCANCHRIRTFNRNQERKAKS